MRSRVVILVAVLVVAVLVGVGFLLSRDDDDSSGGNGGNDLEEVDDETAELIERALSESATRRPCSDLDTAPEVTATSKDYRAEKIRDFDQPTWVAVHPINGWSVVVEREGRIVDLESGDLLVDLSDQTRAEHDGGALTAVFSPDGGWLYLYRSANAKDGSKRVVVTAHRVDVDDRTIETDHEEIVSVPQPSPQHDGGGLAFGPDELLWVSFGDGGGLGDPWPNGQDGSNLLGTVIRINPNPKDGGYEIPADNPTFEEPDVLPEVWAIGLRNPWRLTFDDATGSMYLVDVGQSCWEELNIVSDAVGGGGLNFGWDLYEGFEPFQTPSEKPDVEYELTDPWVAYRHGAGRCATVGGFVYSGSELSELDRTYLWSDYCGNDVWAMEQSDDGVWTMIELGLDVSRPFSVVPDVDGEPLVISGFDDANELTGGAVYRIVHADG